MMQPSPEALRYVDQRVEATGALHHLIVVTLKPSEVTAPLALAVTSKSAVLEAGAKAV